MRSGSIIMVKPTERIVDEARWKCERCGKELAYTQPIAFSLALELVKVFGAAHEDCKPDGK